GSTSSPALKRAEPHVYHDHCASLFITPFHLNASSFWRKKSEMLDSTRESPNLQSVLSRREWRGACRPSHSAQPLRSCSSWLTHSSSERLGRRRASKFDDYHRRQRTRGRTQGPNQGLRELARFECKVSC